MPELWAAAKHHPMVTRSRSHGGEQLWCDVCVLTVQLDHARERAAVIPELERRLAAAHQSDAGRA